MKEAMKQLVQDAAVRTRKEVCVCSAFADKKPHSDGSTLVHVCGDAGMCTSVLSFSALRLFVCFLDWQMK